ncbi:hypothetical protein AVEN_190957-1 [Araneus ventricosus]|uniref:Uncharacterized protein n=1 Tax=Araneus ventricosus TaxID=182803 RepID=A0A4Y2RIM2_ARAVE|nr:hypothetical protein AVEN_190957-1 [Araneus ventricosus]
MVERLHVIERSFNFDILYRPQYFQTRVSVSRKICWTSSLWWNVCMLSSVRSTSILYTMIFLTPFEYLWPERSGWKVLMVDCYVIERLFNLDILYRPSVFLKPTLSIFLPKDLG